MRCALATVHARSPAVPSELDPCLPRTLECGHRPALGRGLWVCLGPVEPRTVQMEQPALTPLRPLVPRLTASRATDCTGPAHELAATTPTTAPGFATLPVSAGVCDTPNKMADKFGGGVLAVFTLPGSSSGTLVGGRTIRGMPAGARSLVGGAGVTTAAPGIPRKVCNN